MAEATKVSSLKSSSITTTTSNPIDELNTLDTLFVKRTSKFYDVEYKISENENSKQLYRLCQNSLRATFDHEIMTMNNEPFIRLQRPYKLLSFEQKTEITHQGALLGYISKHVERSMARLKLKYYVTDEKEKKIFIISAPWLAVPMFEATYKIYSPDRKNLIGKIIKKPQVLNVEFEIRFPSKLDCKLKALILASCIFISHNIPKNPH